MGRTRKIALVGAAALAFVATVAVGLWLLSRSPCQTLTGPVGCRVETVERVVALTFDDGPSTRGVDAVLPVLRAHGARATFFLVGAAVEENPALAARLKAEGHELANHSFSHTRMIGRPASFYDAEIARTDALLRAAGETRPTLFRPPYCKRLWGLSDSIARAGYRTVAWDVDADAETPPTPEAYANYVLDRVRPGSIVLIHPMYGADETARRALPAILRGLKARGFRVTAAGELLARGEAG